MPSPDPDEARIFHEGIELFNNGQWFEAHEAWEDIWRLTSGDKKRFYQGLIQYAVTLEHIRRGNPRGMRSVFKSAVPKFDRLPEIYMGINIPGLLADLNNVVRPILALDPAAFDPHTPRGQRLPFDPQKAPKINLVYDPFGDAERGE